MRIEMDQELQTYLHSLKQLYGLLQNDLSCSVCTMLDDKSRLLLKDLLDRASENVFNIHSKRPKPSLETSTFATRNGTKSSALSVEGNGKLRSSVSFSKSPGNSEDSEHSGSTYLDCISSGSESTDYSPNNCRSYLSKQASDAIKKIDIRILDLQRAAQNLEISELSTRVQELSDRMNDIVLQPDSASNVAVQEPLMLARNEPSKTKIDPRLKVDEILPSYRKGGRSREVRKDQPSLQHKARRRFPGQHESDASSSRKTSISYSGSEEHWHPRYETRRRNHVKSPTSRESDKYSLSDDESQEFSVSNGDDSEVYSRRSSSRPYESTSCTSYESKRNSLSTSGSPCQASYSGDDETEGDSTRYKPRLQHPRQPKYFSASSTSTKRMRPRRVSSSIWKNPGKKIGRWKKLKDKIFHHHRHRRHDHVHNQKHTDGDHDDLSCPENRKAYGRLPSKHIERQAVKKNEKALIHGRDSKMVQKSVNAMRGLLKHARRAKRSKLSARKIKPLQGSKYGKTAAKMNWMKILHRHKKAKKLGLIFY